MWLDRATSADPKLNYKGKGALARYALPVWNSCIAILDFIPILDSLTTQSELRQTTLLFDLPNNCAFWIPCAYISQWEQTRLATNTEQISSYMMQTGYELSRLGRSLDRSKYWPPLYTISCILYSMSIRIIFIKPDKATFGSLFPHLCNLQ